MYAPVLFSVFRAFVRMSSARTSGHGLVVITKIIPLEEDCDIPMTNVISEVNKPTIHYQKVPEMTRLFQKAYPMQLGVSFLKERF